MDGYGDPDLSDEFEGESCPFGWVSDNTDCDDANVLVHPGAPELPDDGIDQDCDGGDLVLSDTTGVFVALSTGNDANPGTMAAPKQTIRAGKNHAALAGKSVFIAAGNYWEDVETEVSLFGGYESTGWTRDIDTYLTTLSSQWSTVAVVWISGLNPVAIQGFTINGGGAGAGGATACTTTARRRWRTTPSTAG